MDPVGAFIIAVFVLVGGVRGWWASARARLTGDTEALDARREQERQRDHDLRSSAQEHRHAERMAGRGYPSFSESLGAGLGRRLANPRQYDELGPLGRWWWRRREEWAERDEQRRKEQAERTARGEQPHQKAGKWAKWVAQWAWARAWRYWADSEPGRARQRRRDGIVDAEVVDDPPARPEAPGTDPGPPPPPADAPPTAPGPGGPAPSRPGPVRATAERTDTRPEAAPLELEPGWPGDTPEPASTRSDQGPAGALEAATDEGDNGMGKEMILVGAQRRGTVRHNQAAVQTKNNIGLLLAGAVGMNYTVEGAELAVAQLEAAAVGFADAVVFLEQDLRGQEVKGLAVDGLTDAANLVHEAAALLYRVQQRIRLQGDAAAAYAAEQHRLGIGRAATYTPEIR